MEISGITSNNPIDPSRLPIESLAGNDKIPEVDKIKEVARQFEAILLRQMLKNAQKTVIKSGLTDDSVNGGIYRDMVTNQLADSISQSGTFGFAESLERELTRQLIRVKPEENIEN